MRISDWSSDVCSSDLLTDEAGEIFELFCLRVEGALLDDRLSSSSSDHFLRAPGNIAIDHALCARENLRCIPVVRFQARNLTVGPRSEEHTSELQSLMRISYAVFCLKKKN